MHFAIERPAGPSGRGAATPFPVWLRAQRERNDAVGSCARVLLRLALAPGARSTTIGQLLELDASITVRRYIRSVLIDTGHEWLRRRGLSKAQLGHASSPGHVDR